ncbi:MAG: iron ABC transporter permease [Armatimonadota bacterium]|nr:iron ABC transporter permease [Armatimonadota bacterium]MDR7421647.1 iron ABC transporter permease [Armatimonadota bacterium]MDR7455894.1 iron ABC transporter permease [Armatimonadota bacterium]
MIAHGAAPGHPARPRGAWRRLAADPAVLAAALAIQVLLLVFIVWPLVRVVVVSLTPGGLWSTAAYAEQLRSWYIQRAVVNSLLVGVLTAGVSVVLGFAYAYTLVRTAVPLRRLLHLLAILPIVSPPFVSSIAIILLFGRGGIITSGVLGLQDFNIYGFKGLLLAQVMTFAPVAYLILRGVLEGIDPTLEDAALNLGAGRLTVFRRVLLPLATPGIASAFLVVFIESLADFGNPLLLAGSAFPILSVQAYLQITGMFNLPAGAALSVLLLAPSIAAFLIYRAIVGRRRYVTITGKPGRSSLKATSPLTTGLLFATTALMAGLVVLFYAVIAAGALARTWGVDNRPSLDALRYVLSVGGETIRDTLTIAVTATPVSGLLGMVVAFLVVRRRFPGRGVLEMTSLLNFALPGTVVGIGYILAFNQRPLLLTGTMLILVACFVFRYVPVGIQSGIAVLRQIDPAIEEAAQNLGASSALTFRRVTLPLVRPAFFSALVFAFVRAMTAISAAVFLVSANWNLMTVQILSEVGSGRYNAAAAYSMVLLAIVVAAIAAIGLLLRRGYSPVQGRFL